MTFLDTDILSYFFKGNTEIRNKISEYTKKGEPLCLSTINVYEVLKGLRYHNNSKIESEFNKFLQFINIYSINDNSISKAADIYADLRKRGLTIGDADILIASIVIANNGTLVSNNKKHYENIKDLKLVEWC
jgi:tRNA(fMet)-specific endonuclease VapC